MRSDRTDYQKQYLKKNSEKRKAYFRGYYQKNRLTIIEKAKLRYWARRPAFAANQKVYRQNNVEELRIVKKQGITITQAREQLKGR